MRSSTFSCFALGLGTVVGLFGPACATTAAPEPARSFDRPDSIEALCVQTAGSSATGTMSDLSVLPIERCPALPGTTSASPEVSPLPALRPMVLVAQLGRGELAVVDLARSVVLDADTGTPGLNAIPTAALPTALRVSPDAKTVYLASGTPRAFGVYALASLTVVKHAMTGQGAPVVLPDWIGCTLAERPVAIEVLADDTLAVLTSGGDGVPAKLLRLAAGPFSGTGAGAYQAGQLPGCNVITASALGGVAVPAPSMATWSSGMTGAPLSSSKLTFAPPAVCTEAPRTAFVSDDVLPVATLMRKDGTRLYIGERGRAVVHVVETSSGTPQLVQQLNFAGELGGAWATDIAISPVTRDNKQFAYVVDGRDGALAVFDLSDITAVLAPLRRPRSEASPSQRPDRIRLGAPALSVKFFARDWTADGTQKAVADAKAAVLCTPNANSVASLGASYIANGAYTASPLGPSRMRGVFAAVALTNGDVVFVDVDDWDEPCRRPVELAASARVNGFGDSQTDELNSPWGVARARPGSVSDEWFYPVSVPHRVRSAYALRVSDTEGTHAPSLAGAPSLSLNAQPLPVSGPQAVEQPSMLPARGESADPGWKNFVQSADTEASDSKTMTPGTDVAFPRVRVSWDDPTVHLNQSWSVVYEGALPGLEAVAGTVTADSGGALRLDPGTPGFCANGVEDFAIGTARAERGDAELSALGLPAAAYAGRVGDYVRITSELLPPTDMYWSVPGDSQRCWGGNESSDARFQMCDGTFSSAGANAWTRDLPVLEAYDDHLILGQYTYSAEDQGRSHRASSKLSKSFADKVRCCFHGQLNVAVRTGSQWLANGSANGLLHHVQKSEGGRCTLACQAERRLADSRSLSVPRPTSASFLPPRVTSALAFRNPLFSFVMYAPATAAVARDTTWKFDMRGGFVPLGFSLPGKVGTVSINLRALEIYPNLGEFVALDASSQGLVFVRLDSLLQARPVIY